MKDQELVWTKVKEEHIIKDEWIDFRRVSYRFPNGKVYEPFYQYSRRSYTVIVAQDTEGRFLCVRQYRHGINQVTIEFPAGGIEGEENEYDRINREDALTCAKRELQEETGYVSDEWTHLITVPSNATISDNYAYVYLAKNCHKACDLHLDETEFLEPELYTKEEIDRLIEEENFQQAVHVMAWLLAEKYL